MHVRKACTKQSRNRFACNQLQLKMFDSLFYVSALLCSQTDCHVFGRRCCTSIGYVSIPNQRPLAGHSGRHLAGSRKYQANAGARVLLWKGRLPFSEGACCERSWFLRCCGTWENARIESHNYFIYTSRVWDKMCLAGKLTAGAGCELFIPQQHFDICLAQTGVSSSLTTSLAWIVRWFCWSFLSVLHNWQ